MIAVEICNGGDICGDSHSHPAHLLPIHPRGSAVSRYSMSPNRGLAEFG
jgi:hypothetical protein